MQRVIDTGEPYHTLFDPPPADPRVVHPARKRVSEWARKWGKESNTSKDISEGWKRLYTLLLDRKRKEGVIPAGISELHQAFYAHLRAAQESQGFSFHLLLFYAAECGLKRVWLKRNNLRTTAQISDQTLLNRDGHNLARWIKELRVPASIAQSVPSFRLARDRTTAWDVEKAHQAWRYGVRMQQKDKRP